MKGYKQISTVRVGCYCSMFIGVPYWHGTEIYEPDECNTYFEVDVPQEDWDNGTASVVCPKCGSELCQSNDDFEIVERKKR